MIFLSSCKEKLPKLNYKLGIFPDSIINLEDLNTQWDDYNIDIFSREAGVISSSVPLIFSSNRHSSGGEFNLVQGIINYDFGQTTGLFLLGDGVTTDAFLTSLTGKFNTAGNDFGPYRFFCHADSYEYMFTSTDVTGSNLNLVFSRYLPIYTAANPIPDPVPATLFNSTSNDAYFALNAYQDTAYFCSDRGGDFNIYMMIKPSATSLYSWLTGAAGTPVAIDSINTTADEKCPSLKGKYLVFTSNMDGGHGGFDLYYSVFRNGKWSSPVNMGEGINTEYNEYRPIIGTDDTFSNNYLIFSSDRPGGKGRYDLYFTGITFK